MTSTHLPIESGPTGEWRTRIGIFFAMFLAFSLWFAYDGFIGYPKKNLESIRQALPEKPSVVRINPRVTTESIKKAKAMAEAPGGVPLADLRALLGEPALDQEKEYTFIGPQMIATSRVAEGKVTSINSHPITDAQRVETPNYRVSSEQVQRVTKGMSEDELTRFLGEPAKREPRRLWYVGSGAYASFDVADNNIASKPAVRGLEPSESDILIQKVLAGTLGFVSIFIGIRWSRILGLRVRLDDNGLTFQRRLIPWDAMTGIDTADYLDKGWLDLTYKVGEKEELQRLDSYHIDQFKPIVQAICERKGFVLPTTTARESPAETDADVV